MAGSLLGLDAERKGQTKPALGYLLGSRLFLDYFLFLSSHKHQTLNLFLDTQPTQNKPIKLTPTLTQSSQLQCLHVRDQVLGIMSPTRLCSFVSPRTVAPRESPGPMSPIQSTPRVIASLLKQYGTFNLVSIYILLDY